MLKRGRCGRRSTAALVLSTAVVSLTLAACAREPDVDLVLRGGTIVDGTGQPRYTGDVAVSGSTIVAVGDLAGVRGAAEIDVAGLVVAPGFINLHSHGRHAGLPTAANMLSQGVTTEIMNADGGGPIDLEAQLAEVSAAGLAVNVGTNVPMGSIWAEVNGSENTRPTPEQLREMNRLAMRGLAQGAWGVSSGLDYKPFYYATVPEVVAALEGAGRWRTVFTNHDRITPESGFSSMVGIRETIEIGEATGLNPLITHMKVQGHEQGSIAEVLAMMDSATARGAYTAADVYPYLAGQTSLGALIIPPWAQEGGADAVRERFASPELRARIVREADEALAARFGGPEGVYLPERGVELVTLMREYGTTSGGEAVVRVLESDNPTAILRFGAASDLEAIMTWPAASIACDCDAMADGGSHPRGYGTFPRVLGRYVREQGLLTLEEAIRKMSGLPATTIGMVGRGFVAPGMAADLVVFDPEAVIDRATFEEPDLPSEGILHVLVNGVVALRDGAVTGARGGRALHRPPSHPARPMVLGPERGVRFDGTVQPPPSTGRLPFRLTLDLAQGAGTRFADGSLEIEGDRGPWTVTGLGLLQTAPGWATVSFHAVGPDGVGRGGYLVVDAADPGLDGDGTSVVLVLEGLDRLVGRSESPVEIEPAGY